VSAKIRQLVERTGAAGDEGSPTCDGRRPRGPDFEDIGIPNEATAANPALLALQQEWGEHLQALDALRGQAMLRVKEFMAQQAAARQEQPAQASGDCDMPAAGAAAVAVRTALPAHPDMAGLVAELVAAGAQVPSDPEERRRYVATIKEAFDEAARKRPKTSCG